MARYVFFDQTIELMLPADLASQWDLLYGRLCAETNEVPCLSVRALDRADGRVDFEADGRRQSVRRESLLVRIQDIVQNRVLPAVTSRLLWHGAAWQVDGSGIMVLGESGSGKTTLSLAEQRAGGQVLSDEIAVWNPAAEQLESFPRSMAVRPDTLRLLAARDTYVRIELDEEKSMVPLAAAVSGAPLRVVVFLDWPLDETVPESVPMYELNVLAADTRWQECLGKAAGPVEFCAHPDEKGWWRCRARESIPVAVLEAAIREGGGVLRGYHRGARRVPDFDQAPSLHSLTTREAAERALAELINARAWMARFGAAHLMGAVRAACGGSRCVLCVPGRWDETRQAIRSL